MGSHRCGNAKGMAAWRVKAVVLAASVLCACGTEPVTAAPDAATATSAPTTARPTVTAARTTTTVAEDLCPVLPPYLVDERSPFGWPLAPGAWRWDREDCWEKKYLLCGGKMRSPIDIDLTKDPFTCPTATRASNGVLGQAAEYKAKGGLRASISKYMGSAMVSGDFGSISLAHGQVYDAVQVHISAPSIHKINGSIFDAEMMVIHKPRGMPDGLERSVIVSTMYRIADGGVSKVFGGFGFDAQGSTLNEGLPVWDAPGSINVPSDMQGALQGPSYLYNGSVPAPPCSETVNWFVLGAPQPIGAQQVDKLKAMLKRSVPGVEHRPVYKRESSASECRRVEVNSLDIGGDHEGATCEAAAAEGQAYRSARCWDKMSHCFSKPFSSTNIVTADAVQVNAREPAIGMDEFMHYKPITNLQVRTTDYAVYASVPNHGDMGHLMLKGHIFFAHNISVKPIATHTIDGVRHEAEITIEHVMFGDTYGQGLPGDILDVHMVTSVILVKKGRHSEFLADLGLGSPSNAAAIRDGTHYNLEESIDFGELLKPALEGPWYWYSSNSTHPGCGNSIRWMVFETPLEASMEQLNSLITKVSGPDSTQMPNSVPSGYVWKQHFPAFAVEADETDCSNLPQTTFEYGQESPLWSYGNERCWESQYPLCGAGTAQSPIDIPASSPDVVVGADSFLKRISWKPVSGLRVSNTGHNIQVTNGQMGYTELVGDNGFLDFYSVVQFHLHMPSEHMINGTQYPAELHIVHKKQNSIDDLADDDLLVIGILFDFAEQASPLLEQLYMGNETMISHESQYATLRHPLDLARAVGPVLDGNYYRYEGGLTTPPCSEVVKWFVFENALSMSKEQWFSFKKLYKNPSNNRPIQPLNGRPVHKNSMKEGELLDYRYNLNRDYGRDRLTPDAAKILFPSVGTLCLLVTVSCAMWVREESSLKLQSAGGFDTLPAATLGRRSYEQLPDKTPKH